VERFPSCCGAAAAAATAAGAAAAGWLSCASRLVLCFDPDVVIADVAGIETELGTRSGQITQVKLLELCTLLAFLKIVQFNSCSSLLYHRCSPVGGLSEGESGAELIVMALAPASCGGGTKPGGSATPPPLLPRMGVRGSRLKCTRSGETVWPHCECGPFWSGSVLWKNM
jgi:hypothetical protein